MSKTESEKKAKLKNILIDGNWSVIQFFKNDNDNEIKNRLLFENLPGVLIWDFFCTNFINELKQIEENPLKIKLIAIGIDDVIWEYHLIKNG